MGIALTAEEREHLRSLERSSATPVEILLKLCSHFSRSEHSLDEINSDEAEVKKIKELKKKKVDAARNKIQWCCRKIDACARGYWVAESKRDKSINNTVLQGELRKFRQERIKHWYDYTAKGEDGKRIPPPEGSHIECFVTEITAAAKCQEHELHTEKKVDTEAALATAVAEYQKEEDQAMGLLKEALRSQKFLESTLEVLETDAADWECPICMGEEHEVGFFGEARCIVDFYVQK